MPELLLELGLEEIPARMIAAAEAELAHSVEALLTRQRLLAGSGATVTSYSSPRRLAVRVEGVLAQQLDLQEQLTGPSWKAAFPQGQPSPCIGGPISRSDLFVRSAGCFVCSTKPWCR